ncbi:hypothetical protein LMG31506_02032 [Cupriavidus yeoncheonensis]|uniref:DUF3293 domain-containing protein n=1 Tax=Cupriavidus yeoncheonensis TaxID=1462994 RepID=A0A916IT12_9BURK|nr:DUF3293 domain-containing protein [Cupriavidus yeoncheonensis]CAG2138899.1 hypothetical protein LMG31506_02032 [Cupriavidus yeoncheonensis]
MPARTAIDDATLRAYRETEYCVHGDAPLILKIDQSSAPLAALHARLRVASSAFITAANPFSQPCDAARNDARQQALADELARLGFAAIPGTGQHPDNGWPGEPSFLVPGISLDAASALGTKHGQNAIVWSGADAVPRLILLR